MAGGLRPSSTRQNHPCSNAIIGSGKIGTALVRAFARKAMAHAREAYQKFFDMWKNADQDLPLLIEAKKEFAAL
jgi:predicted dinucleotide-binding enzyme